MNLKVNVKLRGARTRGKEAEKVCPISGKAVSAVAVRHSD